jgi:hypothetical protein
MSRKGTIMISKDAFRVIAESLSEARQYGSVKDQDTNWEERAHYF